MVVLVPLAVLAATAAGLLAATVASARRPRGPIPRREGFLQRWSSLHGGYDPRANRWVHGWLRLVAVAAAPLARRGVHPDALTLWTVWLAGAAVVAALAGGRWPLAAAVLVVAAALADGLDGAVAALADKATAWGHVLDSVLDRVSDVLFVVATWVAGGLAVVAVPAAGVGLLHEYLRARASTAGAGEIGAITVAERPTRVICCAAGLAAAGAAPGTAVPLATTALAVLLALATAGLAQLAVAVRRRLR